VTIPAVQKVQLKFTVQQKSYCVTSGANIANIAGVKTTLTVDHDATTFTPVIAPGW